MALQYLHLVYDHISDSSDNFWPPPKQPYMIKDIIECNEFDRLTMLKYAYESSLREDYLQKIRAFKGQYGNIKYPRSFTFPTISLDDSIPSVTPMELTPSPEEYLDVATDMEYEESLRQMVVTVEENVISLRQYLIVGGVFQIYLIYHPPQPQPLIRFHMTINTVKLPKKLEYVPFYADFNPPEPPKIESVSSKTPVKPTGKGKKFEKSKTRSKKAEDETSTQDFQEWEDAVRSEKEKMLSVTLGLPEGMIYLDLPQVCIWDKNFNLWKISDIHDVEYDYTERTVSFRTCRFGVFGLAVKRHLNLPYYAWDIRPNINDSIAIILQGNKVNLYLTISEENIQITKIQYQIPYFNVGTDGLDKFLGLNMSFCRFMRVVTSSGLDLFPGYDAHCYYQDTKEKHWAMSYITYYSMARMAIRYNFSRSKWNTEVGRRSIIMRVREYNPANGEANSKPFNSVQVTPFKCEPISCTESSESFANSPSFSILFQPNLYRLLNSTLGTSDRAKVNSFSKETIHTLAQFLVHTRLFSFS